jgi:hypothetical protein
MLILLENSDIAIQMGENGKRRVKEKFTKDKMILEL